jgi:hypothetical protein
MPESGTSGSMSGDGKRSDGQRPPVTAPILDSTKAQWLNEAASSAPVKIFGCRPQLTTCDLCWRLASENLQGRKPREKDWSGTACAMGI